MPAKSHKSAKEVAKELRQFVKANFPDYRFSITSDIRSLGLAVVSGPRRLTNDDYPGDHYDVNHFWLSDCPFLNTEGMEMFTKINEFIKIYHWDDSRPEIDYFACAFYYGLHIGKWDKPYQIKS